jgi:hypothetical protein
LVYLHTETILKHPLIFLGALGYRHVTYVSTVLHFPSNQYKLGNSQIMYKIWSVLNNSVPKTCSKTSILLRKSAFPELGPWA